MPRPPEDLQGPSAPSSRQQRDRTAPIAPDGTYQLRIKSMRDVGWVQSRFSSRETGEQEGDKATIRTVVEGDLPGGGVFAVRRDLTHSYDERSILSKLGAVILGIDPQDKEAVLDWRQLVQGRFLGQIKSRGYHPRTDGEVDESVTHWWTDWKGDPLVLPAGANDAPTAPDQPTPATGANGDPGPGGARDTAPQIVVPGSQITAASWTATGPVLRRVFDQFFSKSAIEMLNYFNGREFANGYAEHAETILSFLNQRGPTEARFNFTGRSDADAEDFGKALEAFERRWNISDSGPGPDPDDLPF